jgi:PEGA domain
LRSLRSELGLVLRALVAGLLVTSWTHADEATDSPEVTRARAEFVRGTELVKGARWAEALVAFEQSSKLRPHAVTTYNIGVCQRALGNYTRAREAFARALEQNDAHPTELADALVADDKALLGEMDRLFARANVTLNPANAQVTVDGRPLAVRDAAQSLLVAGVRDPGPGEPPPSGTFHVILNPGAHLFTFSRPGFADAVVNKTIAPGAAVELTLELDRLPATLHVAATEVGAVVAVDGADVGVAPVDVSRPAGTHRVTVIKSGFKRYEAQVAVQPGQQLDLRAQLTKEDTSILSRWWFWTAAGVVLAGVAAGTYALTRSETTTQAPLDGGGLGWTVKVR